MLERLRKNDEGALQALLDEHWENLVRHLVSMCGNVDTAKDATQEAFVRLWSRRLEWDTQGSAVALLYRISRNLILDREKGAKVRQAHVDSALTSAPEHQPDSLEQAVAGDLHTDFVVALDQLPQRRRDVFTLSRIGGLGYAEIAETLGVSRQTVANHMALALADLRLLLRHHLSDDSDEEQDREVHDG